MIVTDRLILRPWTQDDAPHYLRMSHDQGYCANAPAGCYLTRDEAELRQRIQTRIDLFEQQGIGKWPIFRKSDGAFIGTCGVDPFLFEGRSEVEIGYRLLLDFWGQGYASEAAAGTLEWLRDRTVYGFVAKHNAASIKVLEKLGFTYLQPIEHAGVEHRLYARAPLRDCKKS